MYKKPMIPPPPTDLDLINERHRSTLFNENIRLIAENKKLVYLISILDTHIWNFANYPLDPPYDKYVNDVLEKYEGSSVEDLFS